MAVEGVLAQISFVLNLAGLAILLAFAALGYRNLHEIPKEVLAARALIHFDRVARGMVVFAAGFVVLVLGQIPTLLGWSVAPVVLAVASSVWLVLLAASCASSTRRSGFPAMSAGSISDSRCVLRH